MARSRNLKPGFFTNEYLAELPPLTRLLYAGLWTVADREGRLEDRPRKIKAEILPYDNCDADKLLQALADSIEHFIIRYEVDGGKYIQIPKFLDHQNPHIRETDSIIPVPDESIQEQYKNSTRTVQEPEPSNRVKVIGNRDRVIGLKESAGQKPEEEPEEESKPRKTLVDFFESVWKLYPKKEGKGQISKTKKEELQKIGYEEISRCIERYENRKEGTERKYLQNGSTFFNSGYVDYLDKNYVEQDEELELGQKREYLLPGGAML